MGEIETVECVICEGAGVNPNAAELGECLNCNGLGYLGQVDISEAEWDEAAQLLSEGWEP